MRANPPSRPLVISREGTLWFPTGNLTLTKQLLAMAGPDATRYVDLPENMQSLSALGVAPGGKRVAFYFCDSPEDSEGPWPKRGLAMACIEEGVRILVRPSPVSLRVIALNCPPLWSPDGGHVYFCLGDKYVKGRRSVGSSEPGVCQSIDLATGMVRVVGPGTLTAIAPDGRYVIVRDYPKRSRYRSIDTRTLATTDLPRSVRNPKLSPSGAYAASLRNDENKGWLLRLYRTADWRQLWSINLNTAPRTSAELQWATSREQLATKPRDAGPGAGNRRDDSSEEFALPIAGPLDSR